MKRTKVLYMFYNIVCVLFRKYLYCFRDDERGSQTAIIYAVCRVLSFTKNKSQFVSGKKI